MTNPDRKVTFTEWLAAALIFPIALAVYLGACFFDWLRHGPHE